MLRPHHVPTLEYHRFRLAALSVAYKYEEGCPTRTATSMSILVGCGLTWCPTSMRVPAGYSSADGPICRGCADEWQVCMKVTRSHLDARRALDEGLPRVQQLLDPPFRHIMFPILGLNSIYRM